MINILCIVFSLTLTYAYPFHSPAFYNISPADASARLSSWLRQQGVAAVLDVSDGRDLALMETAAEFIERWGRHIQLTNGSTLKEVNGTAPSSQVSPPNYSLLPSMVRYRASRQTSTSNNGDPHINSRTLGCPSSQSASSLPMLASACPGWVCYAEKTHGDFVLPYISSTKSPQVSKSCSNLGHT